MVSLLKKLMGDHSARTVKRHLKTVAVINSLEADMKKLSDDELAHKTVEFRERLANDETLEDLLPEAFAVVREAAWRVLGQRHYDVQLIGGMVLHEGNIAEMKTGEGKTLVATLPAYLNALTGKGVHIITVNDYLARFQGEWMGRLYRFLGLSTGLILHGLDSSERTASYAADITYGTNNEFGFDYLRDNMVLSAAEMVQRGHHFAIVDEVDSILVDEARTPLIISGPGDKPTDMYYTMAKLVERLVEEEDYNVEEKERRVMPTEAGIHKIEKWLGVDHLYEGENMQLSHYLNQALKAKTLFFLDRDYVVKDGEVIIVDEFTGRLMFGRRYSEGLHQAIEAKEGVKIENESITYATITFQNYFRMYEKLSGMTGTALTEEDEFREIYNLDVIVIPTNKPLARKDQPDVVYKTVKAKYNAVINEIVEHHQKGQPVLVGTVSIEKSEILSGMLSRKGVKHQVLNAKFHEKEAEIVAQAGRLGQVTIATNMAGRGTDILLGGNAEFLAKGNLRAKGYPQEVILAALENIPTEDPQVLEARELYKKLYDEAKEQCKADGEKVRAAGGLAIIGTERHESRRIDNQLRGRAGRQGDPGESRFYVALDDDLMRLFGGDRVSALMDRLGLDEETPIDAALVSRAIENAQKKVEARNFDIRKHVLRYDDVMNKQREIIYGERKQVLNGEGTREIVMAALEVLVKNLVDEACPEHVHEDEWDRSALVTLIEQNFLPPGIVTAEDLEDAGKIGMAESVIEKAQEFYKAKEERLGEAMMRQLEQFVLLRTVDSKWVDHLDAMDDLREGIGLRAYGQEDPLVVYQREAYEVFNGMTTSIQEDVVRAVFRLEIARAPQPEPKRVLMESGGSTEPAPQPTTKAKEVGRNDLCPCGSGKKYKHCHGTKE